MNDRDIWLIFYQSHIPCVWETIIASLNIFLNFLLKTNPFHYQVCSKTFILLPQMVYKFCYSSRILYKKINFGSQIISFICMIEKFDWFSINRRYLVFEKQSLLPGIFVSISCSRLIFSTIRFTKPHLFLYHEWYISFVIVPGFWK